MKHIAFGMMFVLSPLMVAATPAVSTPVETPAYSTSAAPMDVNVDVAAAEPASQEHTGWLHRGKGGDDGHGKIVATFGVAGMYSRQYTLDSSSGQYGADGKTHQFSGWAVTPEVNLAKHIGLQADFISLYDMTPPDGINHVNKLAFLAGPRYTFNPYWRVTPFIFGEAGETRTSYGHTYYGYDPHPGVDWAPTARAGIGFDVKPSRNFAIQIVPGEWMGERTDWNGKWQHNYQARLGFVFYLRK